MTYRNPGIVDTQQFDDADFDLVEALRNAYSDEQLIREATQGKPKGKVTKACKLLLSQNLNAANKVLSLGMVLKNHVVVRAAAKAILESGRFSETTENEAKAALEQLKR